MKAILAAVEARADHFTLLQVPRQVEPAQLRDAYFRLAKIVHPDLPAFAGNPALRNEATRAFQAITSANSTLADPSRRKAYMLQMMQAAIDRAETASEGLQARAVQTANPQQPVAAVPVQTTQAVRPVQATQQTQAAPVMTAQQQAVRATIPQQPVAPSQTTTAPQPTVGISAPGAVTGPPLTRTGLNPMVGQPPTGARQDFTVPPRQDVVVPGRVTGASPVLSTGTFSSLARTGSRPVIVEDINAGRRTSSHTIVRASTGTGPLPTAPSAVNRPLVPGSVPTNLTVTGQFQPLQPADSGARPPSGVFAPITGPQLAGTPIGATGQFTRPTGTMPQGVLTPSGLTTQTGLITPAANTVLSATGQFQRPTPGPQSVPPDTAPQSVRAASTTRGLEPPPNAEVARIYMHTGRQQLNRRDWAGAQEALELSLPLLEGKEMADAKVMLGWAIFNNNANPEDERIERPKKMWSEVATQFPKTPFHAQSAYYLAVWHKLHGELRHVMNNLQQCLDLQPNHIEAAREKRLMETRRSNLAELKELEEREKAMKSRRASSTATPVGKPTPAVVKKVALPKEQTWLEKIFGGAPADDKKKK